MIKDSGERREFGTGAVRDISDLKGRCDLMPLDVVGAFFDEWCEDGSVLECINNFQETGDCKFLYAALREFQIDREWDAPTMFLELAIHFFEGSQKYGPNNWQKGIPVRCYIDSAVRHYLKWRRGDDDEPHDRSFVWNIVCCLWTVKHLPEMKEA